jgi:hypothetical protein
VIDCASLPILTSPLVHFRQKLDLFVWRLHQRMLPALETQNWEKIASLLRILADYMRDCATVIMASQVVDICMESLVKIKCLLLLERNPHSPKVIVSTYQWLTVMGEIVSQSRNLRLDEYLLEFFLENEALGTFVQNYATHVMLAKIATVGIRAFAFCPSFLLQFLHVSVSSEGADEYAAFVEEPTAAPAAAASNTSNASQISNQSGSIISPPSAVSGSGLLPKSRSSGDISSLRVNKASHAPAASASELHDSVKDKKEGHKEKEQKGDKEKEKEKEKESLKVKLEEKAKSDEKNAADDKTSKIKDIGKPKELHGIGPPVLKRCRLTVLRLYKALLDALQRLAKGPASLQGSATCADEKDRRAQRLRKFEFLIFTVCFA